MSLPLFVFLSSRRFLSSVSLHLISALSFAPFFLVWFSFFFCLSLSLSLSPSLSSVVFKLCLKRFSYSASMEIRLCRKLCQIWRFSTDSISGTIPLHLGSCRSRAHFACVPANSTLRPVQKGCVGAEILGGLTQECRDVWQESGTCTCVDAALPAFFGRNCFAVTTLKHPSSPGAAQTWLPRAELWGERTDLAPYAF